MATRPTIPALIYKTAGVFLLVFLCNFTIAQNNPSFTPTPKFVTGNDLFNTQSVFVENIDQYGDSVKGTASMGKILFGYEGSGMPVYFTAKGLMHVQQKKEHNSTEEEKSTPKGNAVLAPLIMEWVGANPNTTIIMEEMQQAYHTYGMLTRKANCYKKVIYKDIYPGIDIIYTHSKWEDWF